jgi:DNA-binding FrmR family transcriptional regulator
MDEARKGFFLAVSGEVKKALLTRFRRIEGQTRGLQSKVEEENTVWRSSIRLRAFRRF